jgi:hypothetical protein
MLARILVILQQHDIPHNAWAIFDQLTDNDEARSHGFALVVGPEESRTVEFIFNEGGELVAVHDLT